MSWGEGAETDRFRVQGSGFKVRFKGSRVRFRVFTLGWLASFAAGSGQRAAGSGQRAAGSGQRAAGSGQRAAGSGQLRDRSMCMAAGWTGCGTALVTPFARDGSVDERAVPDLARRQVDAGIDFLVPCGTTGESPTLSLDERVRVVELVVEAADGK